MEIDHAAALARRHAFREKALAELEAKRMKAHMPQVVAFHRPARKPLGRPVRMAVATKGSGVVNEHFGYVREFLVYEASESGVRFIGHRKTDKYCGGSETCGDGESRIDRIIRALEGCEVVLCARIGFEPWGKPEAAGIRPDAVHAMEPIEDAVTAMWREMLEAEKLQSAASGERRA